MKITSYLRHVRNVFENALPDADIDREYFDVLERSGELLPDGESTAYAEDGLAADTEGSEDNSGETASSETNTGYIHTIRGVRLSFADINHISNQASGANKLSRTQPGYVNTLDLTTRKPSREDVSPHVLDSRS
jgi:hypothetical protein